MDDNLRTIGDYTPETFERVKRTCLTVATVLGDWLEQVTVVGGIVPSLLVPQDRLPLGAEPHAGTTDLDLALELMVLDAQRYASIAELLRAAGYVRDVNDAGNPTCQRWRTAPSLGYKVVIDFLIPRADRLPASANLQHLERDFAAMATAGLHLVARHRLAYTLSGHTESGERATRTVYVCGPGAFVILKAHAIRKRRKYKDSYDLDYLLRHYPGGLEAICSEVVDLLADEDARQALGYLELDYATIDTVGPARAASFVWGSRDPGQADAFDDAAAQARALVQDLLAATRLERARRADAATG